LKKYSADSAHAHGIIGRSGHSCRELSPNLKQAIADLVRENSTKIINGHEIRADKLDHYWSITNKLASSPTRWPLLSTMKRAGST
jgi:hypothetical protein